MCVNMNRQVISNIGRGPDQVKKANKEDLIEKNITFKPKEAFT